MHTLRGTCFPILNSSGVVVKLCNAETGAQSTLVTGTHVNSSTITFTIPSDIICGTGKVFGKITLLMDILVLNTQISFDGTNFIAVPGLTIISFKSSYAYPLTGCPGNTIYIQGK